MTDLPLNLENRTRGGVAVLTLAHSPVNAIGRDLRAELSQALAAAAQDPHITAVILNGRGAHFSVGADVAEFGASGDGYAPATSAQNRPSLAELCAQIEAMHKPVIAAIHGSAIGDGLEICLACHYRIADLSARMAYPAVTFGLLPGGGGTQRLPRLVGAEHALRLLLDAQPIAPEAALRIGLIDEIAPLAPNGSGALDLALARAKSGVPLRRTMACKDGLHDKKAYFAVVAAERARAIGLRNDVWGRMIDCVEAAVLLSPEQGLDFERFAAQELLSSDASKGLRHAFFCERRATRPSVRANSPQQPSLGTISIWGASGFAVDLAFQALAAGLTVTWVDTRREALAKCLGELTKRQAAAVQDGRMSIEAQQADFLRLKVSQSTDDLRSKDIVFVSADGPLVPASMPEMRVLQFGGLRDDADNSSAVAMTVAPATGLLCEIAIGPDAAASKCSLAYAFARKMNWKTIEVGPGGPIETRLRQCLMAVISYLERTGVSRDVISQALLSFGIGAKMRSLATQMPANGEMIVQTVCAALANEGFHLLGDGVAKRPHDIDALAVLTGYFPRWQGGPTFWAQRTGLWVMRAQLHALAGADPDLFTPAPLLEHMISENITLAMLNKS